jgi:transposase
MDDSWNAKLEALRKSGTHNAAAEKVSDELFGDHEFFDARDLVQVKYEMLRCVREDRLSVTEAARRFGFSRTAFYQALSIFEQQGIPGLIPSRPGPKEAHKLNESVMEFLEQQLVDHASLRPAEMAERITQKFGISVHPRSIERALSRRRKKGR